MHQVWVAYSSLTDPCNLNLITYKLPGKTEIKKKRIVFTCNRAELQCGVNLKIMFYYSYVSKSIFNQIKIFVNFISHF